MKKNEEMNDNATPSATEDMLADLGVDDAGADQLRALLAEVADLAHEVPAPSDDVRALLGGATPLRSRRRMAIVAAAAGALTLGGVSAAAATNRLPEQVQEVVADATGGVVPHPVKPVKPTNPPYDAPGHIRNKPKATAKPEDTTSPKPANAEAPGQIQKLTKPDPTAPGPAHPADPGSHGRAHNPDKTNSSDHPAAGDDSTGGVDSDDDGDDDGASGHSNGKPDND